MYDIFVKTNLVIDHSMLWTGGMVAQHELTAAINSMVAGYVGSGTQTNNIDLCYSLQWRHNERDVVPNHRCLDCLLNPFSGVHQRKHQSSASLAFVRWIPLKKGQ